MNGVLVSRGDWLGNAATSERYVFVVILSRSRGSDGSTKWMDGWMTFI